MRTHNFYFEVLGFDGRTIDALFRACSRPQARRVTQELLRSIPAAHCVNSYQEFGPALFSASRH